MDANARDCLGAAIESNILRSDGIEVARPDGYEHVLPFNSVPQIIDYDLWHSYKSQHEITTLRMVKPSVADFYISQNRIIETLLLKGHSREDDELDAESATRAKVAEHIASIILLPLQLWGAVAAGYITLFTVLVDTICALLVTCLQVVSDHLSRSSDPYWFPGGTKAFGPLANITSCAIMVLAMFAMVILSIQQLATNNSSGSNTFTAPTAVSFGSTIAIKGLFLLRSTGIPHRSCRAHMSHLHLYLEFCTGVFGLVVTLASWKSYWWIDPVGSCIIALWVATAWLVWAFCELPLLTGQRVKIELYNQLVYVGNTLESSVNWCFELILPVVVNHSPLIQAVDSMTAFYRGDGAVVEVRIVLPVETSLERSCEVCQMLESNLYEVPGVSCAYVTASSAHDFRRDSLSGWLQSAGSER